MVAKTEMDRKKMSRNGGGFAGLRNRFSAGGRWPGGLRFERWRVCVSGRPGYGLC